MVVHLSLIFLLILVRNKSFPYESEIDEFRRTKLDSIQELNRLPPPIPERADMLSYQVCRIIQGLMLEWGLVWSMTTNHENIVITSRAQQRLTAL
ncbi:hypothetical protein TNCV_2559231 [Trichonephila clavipes]|nr:hypothetical protein TNCV_2559231 [Trichonephila clavipes]